MCALGPEVSRQAAPVRDVVTECLGLVLDFLTRLTAGMVGALAIARAMDDLKVSEESSAGGLDFARHKHEGISAKPKRERYCFGAAAAVRY